MKKRKTKTASKARISRRAFGGMLALGGTSAPITLLGASDPPAKKKASLHLVIIPKVIHAWFDEVHKGALSQAELLRIQTEITLEYLPPRTASLSEQNQILKNAAAKKPDGIAIDPLDRLDRMPLISRVQEEGIPIVLFDSPSPHQGITSVGNDFSEQGTIAAERLVSLLGEQGKIAVMQGFPTAPNHKQRYDAQLAVLKKHPAIGIVDGGIDNDDIETAEQMAAAVLAAHPDLGGYLCCDASGPVGIARAILQAKKVGKVKVVAMDGIKPILQAIKEGIIESSSSTLPRMQGSMSVLMLWQASLGVPLPRRIDTGIDVITRENVDSFLSALES